MASDRQRGLKDTIELNRKTATGWQNAATGPLARRGQIAEQIIKQGGLPTSGTEGFSIGRGVLADSLTSRNNNLTAALMKMGQGQQGGNVAATMTGTDFGKMLAAQMGANRLQEAGASIEGINAMLGIQMGGAGQAGQASLAAAQNQIQATSMLPNSNPLADAIVGGASLAGAGWGAYQQGQANKLFEQNRWNNAVQWGNAWRGWQP